MGRLLIHNIGLLATPEGDGPKAGPDQGKVRIRKDAWILIDDETIVEIGEGGVRKFVGGYDDYRERVERDAAQAAADRRERDAARRESNPNSREAQRRARAAERERNAPLLRSLRRRVAAAEERIAALEKEQSSLVEALAAGGEGAAESARRLAEIEKELSTVNALWEQAASELAFLEAE